MSEQITIGGRLITVPPGYIQAEHQYCVEEDAVFNILSPGPKKEEARTAVLEKRIEFYDRYTKGLIKIFPIRPIPKSRTFWQKLARWSLGHKWNE